MREQLPRAQCFPILDRVLHKVRAEGVSAYDSDKQQEESMVRTPIKGTIAPPIDRAIVTAANADAENSSNESIM